MPRKSRTDNVRKRCGCAKWKTCAHAWYLDYQRDKDRFRENLDNLIGRHPTSFTEARLDSASLDSAIERRRGRRPDRKTDAEGWGNRPNGFLPRADSAAVRR